MVMTAVFAIPASAVDVSSSFSGPYCGCSVEPYTEYAGGISPAYSDRAYAWAHVDHSCNSAYAYTSMKCWIAPMNSLNNYTSRTFTDSGTNNGLGLGQTQQGMATADLVQNYGSSTYALLGVENYYKVSVTHNGIEYSSQAWSSDGDIPLSYIPPVVTE